LLGKRCLSPKLTSRYFGRWTALSGCEITEVPVAVLCGTAPPPLHAVTLKETRAADIPRISRRVIHRFIGTPSLTTRRCAHQRSRRTLVSRKQYAPASELINE